MNVSRVNDLLRINSYYKYCCSGCANKVLADFPATFNVKDVQNDWYNVWESNKYFNTKDTKKEAVSMILPPPNITGVLHLGHALTVAIQDTLARWYRMKGHPVIWIPGLDHAGIATQTVVEKHLAKVKDVTKSDLGKEQFISSVWDWKNQKENFIRDQLKALGATLDWSKEYFTMSKNHEAAVVEALTILHERDLLYRTKAPINWCPTLRSTISDIEVEKLHLTGKQQLDVPGYKKKVTFGQIFQIAYPVKDSKDEIVVATTRPETVFGDVAIAVHPDDDRYTKYIGQYVWHALRETYIPVIADRSVIQDFGTGAVKITPAHDRSDYMVSKTHGLEIINVIDENGNITEAGKQLQGLPRYIAREKVLNELSNRDLLRATNDHPTNIPRCSRSNDIIECLLKEQWYIKCDTMAQRAVEVVRDGHLKIDPAVHEQVWYDWLENIRDWCISRQLWWGHRLPVYQVATGDVTDWIVARSENDARIIAEKKYGSNVELRQDDDVLDTWFSSAILPFTALGWPNKTKDFEKYYPLTLMETGSDILFFWVARMVMLGLELTDRLPFKEVLLHGLLSDAHGKKMSKSVGNVISPENIVNGISLQDLLAQAKESHNMGILQESELKRTITVNTKLFPRGIPECGVDALRLTLCSPNIKNQTVSFDVMQCQTNKFFGNKIWQASRYILRMVDGKLSADPKSLATIDRWILSRMSVMVDTVDDAFTNRNFHRAVASIKQFFYYEFCDFYLEGTKWGFKSENSEVIASHTDTLIKCLEVTLRILAPVMPYLADDLYKRLSNELPGFLSVSSLLEASYPMPEEFKKWRDVHLDERMNELLKVISEIRVIMARVSRKSNPTVHVLTRNSDDCEFYTENVNLIKGGSNVYDVSVFLTSDYLATDDFVCHTFTPNCTLLVKAEDVSILEQVKSNINKKSCTEKSKVEDLRTTAVS